MSPRKDSRPVPVKGGGPPAPLLESEDFVDRAGAYAGAKRDRPESPHAGEHGAPRALASMIWRAADVKRLGNWAPVERSAADWPASPVSLGMVVVAHSSPYRGCVSAPIEVARAHPCHGERGA